MAELVNEFSWSRRRDEVFVSCPRQYYYEYYASWGGWSPEAPSHTRTIYILKQLMTRHMWAGDVVHRCIARTLENIRRGITPLDTDEILRLVREEMRGSFRSSRQKVYQRRPKTLALYEHEYELKVSDDEWRRIVDGGLECLRTFYDSSIYHELARLSRAAWLEIEHLSSFQVDGIKVWVKLDCSHRQGEGVRIIDWKTGRLSDPDQTIQLACYALYGVNRWNVRPEDMQMTEFNLARNEAMSFEVTQENLTHVTNHIRAGVSDMRALLLDPSSNLPRAEEEFPLTTEERNCERCKYRRICPRFAAV